MRSCQKILLLLVIITIAPATNLFSQVLPDSTIKKIDNLFKAWDKTNTPGCAVGIVRNDSLIFAKGYGMANLEYGIPITPETIFHMASVSKQFTAYSIVLLAQQGKLQLDDDIHKYLAWFPDLKEKITIRNLLNHTSGIRDQWQLLAISGTRLDDVITQDHIIKILSKQQALNFKPGAQNSYSNSGFTMLAEIVRSITGQSLRQFTDSAIFKPLGMNNTHFHDDYTEIVPNRSYSYSYDVRGLTHYANSILSYATVGATSLFTNINDMSKWLMNFYDHKVGDQQDIALLTEKAKLSNGKELTYASGIVSDKYKGWQQFSHGGSDAGYRTFVTVLPGLKMGFIVFSNLGVINPGDKAYEIADLFIRDSSKPAAAMLPVKPNISMAIVKDTTRIKEYMGDYMSEDGVRFSYNLQHQTVFWKFPGNFHLLVKAGADTFFSFNDPTVTFVFSKASGQWVVNEYWPGDSRLLVKYVADTSQPDDLLQQYTGVFYCPELDCTYGIALKNHHLVLTNDKYNDAPLALAGANDLFSDTWWMSHLKVLRNSKKQIKGFEVNSGRVMHLLFNKIE
ncbi:MAG: serine hydrolase domain-containing protein [Ginsengibacter sp.]